MGHGVKSQLHHHLKAVHSHSLIIQLNFQPLVIEPEAIHILQEYGSFHEYFRLSSKLPYQHLQIHDLSQYTL